MPTAQCTIVPEKDFSSTLFQLLHFYNFTTDITKIISGLVAIFFFLHVEAESINLLPSTHN